jgi:hypothetical protein
MSEMGHSRLNQPVRLLFDVRFAAQSDLTV